MFQQSSGEAATVACDVAEIYRDLQAIGLKQPRPPTSNAMEIVKAMKTRQPSLCTSRRKQLIRQSYFRIEYCPVIRAIVVCDFGTGYW